MRLAVLQIGLDERMLSLAQGSLADKDIRLVIDQHPSRIRQIVSDYYRFTHVKDQGGMPVLQLVQHNALVADGFTFYAQHHEVELRGIDQPVLRLGSRVEHLPGFAVIQSPVRGDAIYISDIVADHLHRFFSGGRLAGIELLDPLLVTHQSGRFIGYIGSPEAADEAFKLLLEGPEEPLDDLSLGIVAFGELSSDSQLGKDAA